MKEKVNMQDLISLFASQSGITKKESELFLKEYFNLVSEALLEDKNVKIKNIGSFKLTLVNERESVDVNKGTRMIVPAHYKVSYIPDSQLAKKINEPFAFFEVVELQENISDSDQNLRSEELKMQEEREEIITLQEKIVIEEKKEIDPQTPQDFDSISEKHSESIIENINTENKIDFDYSCPQRKKQQRHTRLLWLLSGLIILLIGGIYYYEQKNDFSIFQELLFIKPTLPFDEVLPIQHEFTMENIPKKINVAPEQEISNIAIQEDTVLEQPDLLSISENKPISIIKKRVIASGERLTLISLEEYGHKSFWVYLFEENKSIINNPNNVPVGIEIIIPEASKYNINKEDPESIKRADEIAKTYKK